jgi:heme/copper-type cytochrome/quinol oxidase subunit 1
MLMALSEAWTFSIGLIAIFGVIFPALMTGLIVFAVAQALGERQDNQARRNRR